MFKKIIATIFLLGAACLQAQSGPVSQSRYTYPNFDETASFSLSGIDGTCSPLNASYGICPQSFGPVSPSSTTATLTTVIGISGVTASQGLGEGSGTAYVYVSCNGGPNQTLATVTYVGGGNITLATFIVSCSITNLNQLSFSSALNASSSVDGYYISLDSAGTANILYQP